MTKLLSIFLLFALLCSPFVNAKLERHTYYSKSIENNVIGTNPERVISVYLPASYDDTPNKIYPVVYFLGAYSWSNDFALPMEKRIDRFGVKNQPIEFIVVMLDGDTPLRGSFYVNSKAHGYFEDFIMSEAIPWVRSHFRVSQNPSLTAIAGYSMGGTGALRLAARHPTQFGHVYALSPGVFNKTGLEDSFLSNKSAIEHYNTFRQHYAKVDDKLAFMSKEFAPFQGDKLWDNGDENSDYAFILAYGGAFASHPNEAFGIHYSEEKGAYPQWQAGFGDILTMYMSSSVLDNLNSVLIEVGDHDEFRWITNGCVTLKVASEEADSIVKVNVFEGDHGDHFGQRIEQSMLPHFVKVLSQSTITTSN